MYGESPRPDLGTCRQDASLSHLDHGLHLAAHARDVVLIHHLLTCFGLLSGVDLQGLQQLLVLLRVPSGNGLGRGVEVWQATLASLNGPLSGVAVAGENHVLVLLEELCHSVTMAHATLNQASQVSHSRGHDGVADLTRSAGRGCSVWCLFGYVETTRVIGRMRRMSKHPVNEFQSMMQKNAWLMFSVNMCQLYNRAIYYYDLPSEECLRL